MSGCQMHTSGPYPPSPPGRLGRSEGPSIIMNWSQERKKKKQSGVLGWNSAKPARPSGEIPYVLEQTRVSAGLSVKHSNRKIDGSHSVKAEQPPAMAKNCLSTAIPPSAPSAPARPPPPLAPSVSPDHDISLQLQDNTTSYGAEQTNNQVVRVLGV